MSEQKKEIAILNCKMQAQALRILSEAVAQVSDYLYIEASETGIKTRGMDASHICLLDTEFDRAYFNWYSCPRPVSFSFRVDELLKVLRPLIDNYGSYYAEIEVFTEDRIPEDGKPFVTKLGRIVVRLGTEQSYLPDEFVFRMEEGIAGTTPLPKIEFNSKFTMPVSDLFTVVDKIKLVADYMRIESEPSNTKLVFSGFGGDIKSKTEVDGKHHNYLQALEVKTKSQAAYSLDYIYKFLIPFVKYKIENATSIVVEYSHKMPLKMSVRPFGMRIDFWLAPRIADD